MPAKLSKAELEKTAEIIKKYPVARKVTTDTFFLGTSPVLGKEKIDYVGEIIDKFMKEKV